MLFDPGGRTTASSRASWGSGAIAIVAVAGDDGELDDCVDEDGGADEEDVGIIGGSDEGGDR
jgi:hypothetical protein